MNKIAFIISKKYNITLVISIIYAVLLFFPALVYIDTANPTQNKYLSYFDMVTHGFGLIKIPLMIVCIVAIFLLSRKIIKGLGINKSNIIIVCAFVLHFLLNRALWKDWEKLFYPTGDIFFTYIFYWIVDALVILMFLLSFVMKKLNITTE